MSILIAITTTMITKLIALMKQHQPAVLTQDSHVSSPGRGKASDVLSIALHHRRRNAKIMRRRDEVIIESLNLYGITEGVSGATLPVLVMPKHPAHDPDIRIAGAAKSSSEMERPLGTGRSALPVASPPVGIHRQLSVLSRSHCGHSRTIPCFRPERVLPTYPRSLHIGPIGSATYPNEAWFRYRPRQTGEQLSQRAQRVRPPATRYLVPKASQRACLWKRRHPPWHLRRYSGYVAEWRRSP